MPCWFPQQSVRRSARYRERAIIPQCAPTSIVDENKHTSPTRSDSSFTFPTCTKKDEVCKSRVTWPTGENHGRVYEKYGFIASPPPTYDRKQNKFLSWIRSRLVRHGELYLSGLIRVCWKRTHTHTHHHQPCLRRKIASFIYRCLALFLQSIPYWDAISQETLPVRAGLSFPIAGAQNEAHTKGKIASLWIKSRELHVACWKKGKALDLPRQPVRF